MSMDVVQNQSIPNEPIRHFIRRVAVALRGAAPSRRRWSIWRHAGEQAPPDSMLDLERSFATVRSLVLAQNVDDNRLRTQVENIKRNFDSVSGDLNKDWNELYEVQRLSVFLLSGEALYNETLMRLQDCEDCHAPRCKILTDTD